MPAKSQEQGSMTALMRLPRTIASWRQRRAARRRGLHGLMHMSDRMLADIGVRRADVHAAISGMMPVEHLARTHGGVPWTAQVHALYPRACRQSERSAADGFSAAA
jgi:uncharacterized protein YjiS (DUF1127 family)